MHRVRCEVLLYAHSRPDFADYHDLDAHHVVDPATWAFQVAARSHQPLQVQDVARAVVIQFAANRDAMVDSQDEVLPNVGQGVSPVDLQSLVAVQSEVAQDAALFSVPALA